MTYFSNLWSNVFKQKSIVADIWKHLIHFPNTGDKEN